MVTTQVDKGSWVCLRVYFFLSPTHLYQG